MDEAGEALDLVSKIQELGFLGFLILVICALVAAVYYLWRHGGKCQEAHMATQEVRLTENRKIVEVLTAVKDAWAEDKLRESQRLTLWEGFGKNIEQQARTQAFTEQRLTETVMLIRTVEQQNRDIISRLDQSLGRQRK